MTESEISVVALRGGELESMLGEVARLRIEVFREFPYLYEGRPETEEYYLRSFAAASGAVLVVARWRGEVVGVSTGLPMAEADEAFQRPLMDAGESVADWFYFGESVLRADLRGRGVGGRFFDLRGEHALALGFSRTAFCAVEREPGHPLKPAGYRPLDGFWEARGYRKRPEWVAQLGWEQVDSAGREVMNRLVFWSREAQM